MNSSGVIYVASLKHTFLCEAIASAESLKEKVSDISITLFTDLEDIYHLTISPFNKIIPISSDQKGGLTVKSSRRQDLFENNIDHIDALPEKPRRRPLPANVKDRIASFKLQSWGRGLHSKVISLIHSPYQRTVFLDSDTKILSGEFVRIFDFLEDHSIAMVPGTKDNSEACWLYGPIFNCGMIAYRKNAQIDTLFGEWKRLNQTHLELASQEPPGSLPYLSNSNPAKRQFLLVNDQISFARLLSPTVNKYDIAVKILDETWNARCYPRDRLDGVIIDHADCHKIKSDQVKSFLESRGIRLFSDPDAER